MAKKKSTQSTTYTVNVDVNTKGNKLTVTVSPWSRTAYAGDTVEWKTNAHSITVKRGHGPANGWPFGGAQPPLMGGPKTKPTSGNAKKYKTEQRREYIIELTIERLGKLRKIVIDPDLIIKPR